MHVSILGFGLIGGSLAKALRRDSTRSEREAVTVAAWSPSGDGPRRAFGEGIVDRAPATVDAALGDADIVVLAAPPLACLELLSELGGPLRSALPAVAVVTDVASTKSAILARADAAGLRFVGGHPMAGRETAGYGAATEDLFVGRPWVVAPGVHAQPGDRERVEWLALTCGARPVRLDPAVHDAATAAISHLPLLLAVALVEAVVGPADGPDREDWPAARSLAATGWRDMTRLARGDVEMSVGITATNAPFIAARLRNLREIVDEWLTELEAGETPEPDRLATRFRAARSRAEHLP